MGVRSPFENPESSDSSWDAELQQALLPLDSEAELVTDEELEIAELCEPVELKGNIVVTVSVPPPASVAREEETRTIVISDPAPRFDDTTLVLEQRTRQSVVPSPGRTHRLLSESVTLRPSELSVAPDRAAAPRASRWRWVALFAVAAPLSFVSGAGLARFQSKAPESHRSIVARSESAVATPLVLSGAASPAIAEPKQQQPIPHPSAALEGTQPVATSEDAAEEPATENLRSVRVRVVPSGASLWEKGTRLGTGSAVIEVPLGERREVTARLRGYRSRMIAVDGSHDRVLISLDPLQSTVTAASAPSSSEPIMLLK